MLIDANWRVFTVIWKIKEDILKVIFEIRPHDSCKEEMIALGFNTYHYYSYGGASLMAQTVKNPPAMQETWVLCLGGEDPLEEGVATHSSILTRRIPMDRGNWRATVPGVAKSRTRLRDQAQHSYCGV